MATQEQSQSVTINFEKEIAEDSNIDESNLIGELKGVRDLIYKWNSRLAGANNELKKKTIELDRLRLEKHKYYKHDYTELIKDSELKLYVDGDKDIINLRNEKRIIETKIELLKTAVYTIREKSKTIKELVDIIKNES